MNKNLFLQTQPPFFMKVAMFILACQIMLEALCYHIGLFVSNSSFSKRENQPNRLITSESNFQPRVMIIAERNFQHIAERNFQHKEIV